MLPAVMCVVSPLNDSCACLTAGDLKVCVFTDDYDAVAA